MRNIVASIAITAMLAACGGGDGEAPPPPDGPSLGDVLLCAVFFVLINGACVPDPDNPPPDSPPPDDEPPPDGGSGSDPDQPTWAMTWIVDIEPNDTIDMAQPARIASRTPPDEYVGFIASGNVNDQSDVTDVFVFTAEVSRDYRFNLRLPDNSAPMDVYAAFFRVLDQNGNVLLSTQADEIGRNFAMMHVDAGVAYYVMVVAGDTVSADLDYRFSMAEIAG